MKKPFDLNADYQPKSFEFTEANKKRIGEILALYPKGRQQSGVMPLLDLAQRQTGEEGAKANPPYGGWIPRAAMDKIAEILDMAPVKVYEVCSFYSMYNMAPVGKNLVQVCTTTPCWLCGSADVMKASEKKTRYSRRRNDGRWKIHARRSRMFRGLRQRADGADQR